MWYFDVFAFIFSAHLSASQSIKCRNSHEMSTPDYYSSIIQQLWFISKVQLYLEWKHWNVRWKYCERAMSGDRKRETTHTVRIKLVIMTNVLCAMCRTVFGFVVWFFFFISCSNVLRCMHQKSIHMLCYVIVQRFAIAFCARLPFKFDRYGESNGMKSQHQVTTTAL